jgi:hypothetical protein
MSNQPQNPPQADPPTPAVMMLEVTNNNDFTINDMFDGVPVTFPPGKTVDCTAQIASHLFGYPGELADRAVHMAKRFGWSGKDYLKPEGPGDSVPRYFSLAEKIVISPVYYDLVKRNPNDPIPLDLGDEDADRPVAEADNTGTKVGKRKRSTARPKRDRHGVDDRAGVRLGGR